MRILITGSRDWDDARTIRLALARFADTPDVTLVSGACPTGADNIAEAMARELGWTVERHPADWDRHGKRAGFVRNREMAELGADFCLAFHKDGSRGTQHTINQCVRLGIPITEYLYTPIRAGESRGGWGG